MTNTPEKAAGSDTITDSLATLLAAARACCHCADRLPHPPRPVLRAEIGARLLVIGQAPGRRVHDSGIPWNDPSGDRLRTWLGMDRETFYDPHRVAIIPMGLCYPGTEKGADLPPIPDCAGLWQRRLRAALPNIRLTLLIGSYAQAFHLGPHRRRTMTETVHAHAEYLPDYFPLPHPSWRNNAWIKRHPWFEAETLRRLRCVVSDLFQAE